MFQEDGTNSGVLPSVYVTMPRMSALKLVLWGFLAVLGSFALAFVVGLVNPQEKVNGLWLVVDMFVDRCQRKALKELFL